MSNTGQRTVRVKFDGTSQGLDQAAKQGSKSVGRFEQNMNRASVGILAAGAAISVGLVAVGDQFDNAYDRIRVGTGKIGGQLDGLKDDFRAVAKEVPASFDTVSIAITELNKRTGLTGVGLQKLAEQEIRLAQLTGSDLASTIESTTRLFGDWSIAVDKQGVSLDQLFRASQQTGIGVDQLAQLVVQFGAPLRQLGFGFTESLVMLGKWNKEGVNTELVLGGLKKALGTFAKQGKDPVVALQALIKSLVDAKSTMQANQIAVEALGVKAGPDFAAAVREGRFNYQDLVATVAGGTDTIIGAAKDTDDWKESLQKLKNDAMIQIEPLALSFFDTISTKGIPALEGIVGWTKDHEGATKALTIAVLATAAAVLVVNGVSKTYAATVATVEAITWAWTAAQWALNVALTANPIGLVIVAIGLIIAGVGLIIMGLNKMGISWDDIWTGIKKGFWATLDFLKMVGGKLVDFFTWLGDKITWPFRTAFNWVARAFNNTLGKLHFTVPSWVPGIGGNSFGVPNIPTFARGGDSPGNRPFVVGEEGPELFFPGRSGRIVSNNDSAAMAGGGGDVYVLADFGDGVRQIVRAERVSADRRTRDFVTASAAA